MINVDVFSVNMICLQIGYGKKRERNQRRLQDLGAGQQKDGVAIYKTGKTRMSSVSGGGEQVRVGFLSCAVKSPD